MTHGKRMVVFAAAVFAAAVSCAAEPVVKELFPWFEICETVDAAKWESELPDMTERPED